MTETATNFTASSTPTQDVLIARNIRKIFDGHVAQEVLKGVSVSFPKGQFASIIGPSGSGKSTLLYILGALDRPTSGSLIIAGREVESLSQNEVAALRNELIGFVFQFHFLLPEFTALENVMMPALIGGASPEKVEAKAQQLLERVGLGHKGRQRSTTLSGGEQQRVAVARALINDPQLVLCDEPTGNLDTRNSELVYRLLRELNQEQQQTMIVVTHDPAFAEKTDRIVKIVDGLIAEDHLVRH